MISFLPPNRLLPKVQGSAQARKHSLAFCSNHQGSLEKVTLRKVENYFPCSSGPSRAMGPLNSARLLCLDSEQAARWIDNLRRHVQMTMVGQHGGVRKRDQAVTESRPWKRTSVTLVKYCTFLPFFLPTNVFHDILFEAHLQTLLERRGEREVKSPRC